MRAAVVTISDRGAAGEREDASGAFLAQAIEALPAGIVCRAVVPDDPEAIREAMRTATARVGNGFVVTTGGTGFSPRDNTPEAVRPLLDVEFPGVMEALRRDGRSHTPMAMLSRGVAGRIGESLVVTLPGSLRAVREAWAVLEPLLREMFSRGLLV